MHLGDINGKSHHLGTHTHEQYDALDVSLRDPDDPTYVDRQVEQTDDISHSATRGVFWLSEEEAAELEKDPKLRLYIKIPDRNRRISQSLKMNCIV